MNNLEWLKKNLTKEMKECCSLCSGFYKMVNGKSCNDENDYIECENCKFCKLGDTINFLSQEHKEPIKLKQWEFDVCLAVKKYTSYETSLRLNNCIILTDLLEKGYFKGVTDTSMIIEDILKNCEIVSDDYEGFEDCK